MAEKKYIALNLAKAQFTGNFVDAYPPSLIKALLDTVPAADVEPVRRGVWELDYDRNFHRCSNCKESSIRYTDEWGYEIGEELTNYCPNCGAKMGGEENEK